MTVTISIDVRDDQGKRIAFEYYVYDMGLTINGSHRFDLYHNDVKIAKIYWATTKRLLKVFTRKKKSIVNLKDGTMGSRIEDILSLAMTMI